jgi:hypothetical protein
MTCRVELLNDHSLSKRLLLKGNQSDEFFDSGAGGRLHVGKIYICFMYSLCFPRRRQSQQGVEVLA